MQRGYVGLLGVLALGAAATVHFLDNSAAPVRGAMGAPHRAAVRTAAGATHAQAERVVTHPSIYPTSSRRVVTIRTVTTDNSSAKVAFDPVAGAKDYRIFDVSDPIMVKYAGVVHLATSPYCNCHFALQPDGITPVYPYTNTPNTTAITQPTRLDAPSTEIEWNRLDDGRPHTLVVQAVDQLGPVAPGNLYDWNDAPSHRPAGMLGSDEGPARDGVVSINGQGPYTDTPRVIAQSRPFVVRADPSIVPIPSRAQAQQTFLDTFDSAEAAALRRVGRVYPITGAMTYSLNAGSNHAWTIQYQAADTKDSMPMIEDGHFMDTLFDGGTPGGGDAVHTQYAVMAMIPRRTVDFSGGRMLHLTEEVDNQVTDRRWTEWFVVPAGDGIQEFKPQSGPVNVPFNRSDWGLSAQIMGGGCDVSEMTGPISAANSTAQIVKVAAEGTGQGVYNWCPTVAHWGSNDRGLDNRVRLDLFLTQTHIALFADGALVGQFALVKPLPFTRATVYFTHYVYHTSQEHQDLLQYAPYETYWLNDTPYSDERHWDNMGFEVLPAAAVPANWAALSTLIKMPQPHRPQMQALPQPAQAAAR